jgi:hypothetical protein
LGSPIAIFLILASVNCLKSLKTTPFLASNQNQAICQQILARVVNQQISLLQSIHLFGSGAQEYIYRSSLLNLLL